MKKREWIIVIILIILLTGISIFIYYYNDSKGIDIEKIYIMEGWEKVQPIDNTYYTIDQIVNKEGDDLLFFEQFAVFQLFL